MPIGKLIIEPSRPWESGLYRRGRIGSFSFYIYEGTPVYDKALALEGKAVVGYTSKGHLFWVKACPQQHSQVHDNSVPVQMF